MSQSISQSRVETKAEILFPAEEILVKELVLAPL